MNWIIKTGDHIQFDKNAEKATVIISQRGHFSGQEGDDVLILDMPNEQWLFTAHYQIASIEEKNIDTAERQFTITLRLIKNLEDKLLEDYIYSLVRVTNYARPISHFNRKYSRLLDVEFDAIVEDRIYERRTILGTILNAMHREHQEGFLTYLSIENPQLLTGKVDMEQAFKLLVSYLDFAVIKPVQYLRQSAEILQTIISENDYEQMGFA